MLWQIDITDENHKLVLYYTTLSYTYRVRYVINLFVINAVVCNRGCAGEVINTADVNIDHFLCYTLPCRDANKGDVLRGINDETTRQSPCGLHLWVILRFQLAVGLLAVYNRRLREIEGG